MLVVGGDGGGMKQPLEKMTVRLSHHFSFPNHNPTFSLDQETVRDWKMKERFPGRSTGSYSILKVSGDNNKLSVTDNLYSLSGFFQSELLHYKGRTNIPIPCKINQPSLYLD